MTNKCGRTRQRTNNLRDELIFFFFFFWGGGAGGGEGVNFASELATVYYYTLRSIRGDSQSTKVTKLGVSSCQQNDIVIIDIFNEKRKSCNHRCPDFVYFHTLLFIMYLSAIETLICRREMSLIGSTSFGFTQNTILDFQNTLLNS